LTEKLSERWNFESLINTTKFKFALNVDRVSIDIIHRSIMVIGKSWFILARMAMTCSMLCASKDCDEANKLIGVIKQYTDYCSLKQKGGFDSFGHYY